MIVEGYIRGCFRDGCILFLDLGIPYIGLYNYLHKWVLNAISVSNLKEKKRHRHSNKYAPLKMFPILNYVGKYLNIILCENVGYKMVNAE